jgi:predicted DNA-binding transcriptional regulator YafY
MSSRLSRCLRIFTLLQSGERCNVDRLATELGVNRRTVFRDLAELRAAGIPICYDGQNRSYWMNSPTRQHAESSGQDGEPPARR